MFVMAHEVSLNGQSLGDVDDRILVAGIDSDAAKNNVATASAYGRPGLRVTSAHRDYVDVTVTYMIRVKKRDMATRSELFELASTWAALAEDGAWLTCGHRPDRRIWVKLESLPAEGDPWHWTNAYNIVFRAYDVPYWEDADPLSVQKSSITSIVQPLSVSGNARTVLDVEYTNTSNATCDTFSVNTGSSSIQLTGLACAPGETLVIDHTEKGILRIRIRSSGGVYRSALACRTPASSDDTWIRPGLAQVTISAGATGSLVIGSRGRWL